VERDTAVAVQLRHVGEFGSLRTLAQTLSVALTQCVRRHTWWVSSDIARPQDVAARVHINDDFFERRLTADELRALVESWQNNAISFATFYDNIQRGSVARVGVSADEEFGTIRRAPATTETAQ
jgi:hypothetical protein